LSVILQPTPEVVALFDDVVLLREGAVVYHGPLPCLPEYLRGLGFLPPVVAAHHNAASELSSASQVDATPAPPTSAPPDTPAQESDTRQTAVTTATNDGQEEEEEEEDDLADWVAEWVTFPAKRHKKDLAKQLRRQRGHDAGTRVTGDDDVKALPGTERGAAAFLDDASMHGPPGPPTTTAALVAAWHAHPLYAALVAPPDSTGPKGGVTLASPLAQAQFGSAYVHSALWHLSLLFQRQMLLNRRNKMFIGERMECPNSLNCSGLMPCGRPLFAFTAFRLSNAIVMGLVIASMYYQMSVAAGLNMYGAFQEATRGPGKGNACLSH
jgi:hypothetical protein